MGPMYCAMAFDFSCQRGVWCSIRTSKRTQRGGMCFGAMLTRVAAPRTHESIECIGINELKMIQVSNPLLNLTHTHNGRPKLRQATLRQVCGAKSRKWMEVDERDLRECVHQQQVTWWSWRPLRSGMFFRVLVAPPPVMIAEQAERCL